ncbi:hypothetical protein CXU21_08840 [Akkermansia muciniphila]|nr:hypothetical protein CXU21_08840 [Akkermansia muciniphila]
MEGRPHRPLSAQSLFPHAGTAGTGNGKNHLSSAGGASHPCSSPPPAQFKVAPYAWKGGNVLNSIPHIPIMNLQKQQLLLRLFRYFKGKKGEPHFFNKRNIWLIAIAAVYILTPDEFLLDGIGKLGLLDDAAVILGAIFTVFLPDGD